MSPVSIVIPIYNVRPYVDRCIISILEQTYSDFEAVFIDDGSTDGSMSAVRRFARNDSRIVILSHERNRGLAAARNTGVARAKSEYLTFVDSDDFIAPNLLETLMKATDRGRFDIVETGCEAIDENDGLLWRYEPEPGQIDDLFGNPDSILRIQEWGVTQKLWRTSLFRGSIRFPEGAFWEDISIVPSLIAEAQNLVKVPFVGYSYLQRSDSISNSKSVKHVLDMFRAFERYRMYLIGRRVLEAYSSTFSSVVRNGANYQISQMKPNGSLVDTAKILIELCQVLLEEYLAGRASIDRLSEQPFEDTIRKTAIGGDPTTLGLGDQFRSQIRACSEMK